MRPISQRISGESVRKEPVGYGDSAIYNTVSKMEKIIKDSAHNVLVRKWAEDIVSNVEQYDKMGEIEAVFSFVQNNTRYTRDPLGLEYLQTPPAVLTMIEHGEIPNLDCDDSTMLTLSLLGSIGFPVGVRIASYNPKKTFQHIYGVVYYDNKRIPLDTIRREYRVGTENKTATRLVEKAIRL